MNDIKLQQMPTGVGPSELCEGCGNCCMRYPGIYSPDDINPLTAERIQSLLERRVVIVDWWEGDPLGDDWEKRSSAKFLRPRSVEDPPGFAYGLWMGRCEQHTDEGCRLSFEERPKQCRHLVPDMSSTMELQCRSDYSKRDAAIDWLPHEHLIEEALRNLEQDQGG